MDDRSFLYFESEITLDSSRNLLSSLDNKLRLFKHIDLYFSSIGGDVNSSEVIIDYLNSYKGRITLIVTWVIQSAGFDVFLFYEGNKRVLNTTYGMTHLASHNVNLRNLDSGEETTKFIAYNLRANNDEYVNRLKKYLSEEEINKVSAGKDVYFNRDRLIDFISCGSIR